LRHLFGGRGLIGVDLRGLLVVFLAFFGASADGGPWLGPGSTAWSSRDPTEGRRLRGFLPFTCWKGSSMSWSAGGWVASKGAWGCTMTTWGIAADMDTMSSLLSSSCTMQASLRQRSSSTSCLRARSSLTSCVSAAIWALIRFRTSSRVGWVAGAIVVEAFGKSEHFTHYEFLVMTAINGTININHQLRQTHNQQLHYGKQPAQQSSITHISRARRGRPTEHLTSAIDTNTQRTQKKTSVSHQSKIQTPVIGISRKPKGCLTKSMQVIDLFTLIGNNGELHGGQNTGCDRCHFGQPTLTAEIGPWLRDLPAGDRGYR
jgi:hypothetical protein